MPLITVEGPRLDIEKKRVFVDALAEAGAQAYGFDKDGMIVLIRENAPENVAIGGTLISDRK